MHFIPKWNIVIGQDMKNVTPIYSSDVFWDTESLILLVPPQKFE